MNIAVISHLFPTEDFPHEGKFIRDQLKLFSSEENITVNVFVPTPYSIPLTKRNQFNHSSFLYKQNLIRRVYYISFPKKLFNRVKQYSISANLRKRISSSNFDLVHINWLYPDGLIIPTLKKEGLKTILTIHGSDWYKNQNKKNLFRILSRSLQAADRILVVGPNLEDDILAKLPFLRKKLFRINNSVDTNIYSLPSEKEKTIAIQKLNWDEKKTHLLCIGNHRPEKGIDLLVNSISDIPELPKNIHFHIVGNRDSESINSSPNNELITFHNTVTPEELINYYHASDVYISPSRKEGFGLTMIEAAATGLPVLATPTGIAPEFITSDNGILTKNFDKTSLSEGILKILQKLDSFSRHTIRESVVNTFDNEIIKNKLIEHYDELLLN
ncbi:MAG: glycosyltransferase family 4 protein [Balneolaceae bacterium]